MLMKITYRKSDILKLIREDIIRRGEFSKDNVTTTVQVIMYDCKTEQLASPADINVYYEATATTNKEALLPIPCNKED